MNKSTQAGGKHASGNLAMSWLTGAQHEQLLNAFLKAFNYDELEQMVRTKLDKNLEAIILAATLNTWCIT